MQIYVFRDRRDVKTMVRSNQFDTISRVKSCKMAALSHDELETIESQGELYYLVQGNEVKGIAFNYNDAHKGFRILAHQQFLDGDYNPYPIEIISKGDMEFEADVGLSLTLKYVLLNY